MGEEVEVEGVEVEVEELEPPAPFETLTRRLQRIERVNMGRLHRAVRNLQRAAVAIERRVDGLILEGTVSSAEPLKVVAGQVELSPEASLVQPATLAPGDKVLVAKTGGRLVLLGRIEWRRGGDEQPKPG